MSTDDHTPTKTTVARTPGKRFRRLAELSPIQQVLPPRMGTVGVAIGVALVIVILIAVAVGVPAAEIIKSYTNRL